MPDFNLFYIAETIIKLSMIIMIGLYFIFSNTIMRALAYFENGVDVMMVINREILNPLFLGCFFISGVGSMSLFVFSSGVLSSAGIIFFVGSFLITVFFNVPLNNKLKESAEQQREAIWAEYLSKWVLWNHIRTFFSVVSGFLLCL